MPSAMSPTSLKDELVERAAVREHRHLGRRPKSATERRKFELSVPPAVPGEQHVHILVEQLSDVGAQVGGVTGVPEPLGHGAARRGERALTNSAARLHPKA